MNSIYCQWIELFCHWFGYGKQIKKTQTLELLGKTHSFFPRLSFPADTTPSCLSIYHHRLHSVVPSARQKVMQDASCCLHVEVSVQHSSFCLISSGTLRGCHPSGTSTLPWSISSSCCLCCICLILFSSRCFLLLFVFPLPLFLIFCLFLNVFFLGHNKLVWWALFCPVVGLLKLPMPSTASPGLFSQGQPCRPSSTKISTLAPRTQATRCLVLYRSSQDFSCESMEEIFWLRGF